MKNIIIFFLLYTFTIVGIPLDELPYHNEKAFSDTQGNIELTVQELSHDDCKTYFGKDLIRLGLRPVVVELTNKSNAVFKFNPSYLSLFLCSQEIIKSHLTFNLFSFWSLVVPSCYFYCWHETRFYLALIIAALWKYNHDIQKNIERKVIHATSELTIRPFEKLKKVFFFKEQTFLTSMTMNFFNEDTKLLIRFNIDLLQKYRDRENHYMLGLTLG
jgi:hypothetical protein